MCIYVQVRPYVQTATFFFVLFCFFVVFFLFCFFCFSVFFLFFVLFFCFFFFFFYFQTATFNSYTYSSVSRPHCSRMKYLIAADGGRLNF